jgi:hypothetical protein
VFGPEQEFAMRDLVASLVLTSLALVLAPARPAGALDVPARKPGLWNISLTFAGGPAAGHTIASEHCIDAETDKLMNAMGGGTRNDMCSKMEMQKTATGYVFDSICNSGTGNLASHGVITGSFDSAYTVDVTAKHEGGSPVPGMPAETQMQISAKWTGACKPGQQPGDMMLANGLKMNIKSMPGIGASAKP